MLCGWALSLVFLVAINQQGLSPSTGAERKIFVDDEEDSQEASTADVDNCRDGMPPCNLRAAIVAANGMDENLAVRIVLPRGKFNLASKQLPTITRSLFITGAGPAGRSSMGSNQAPRVDQQQFRQEEHMDPTGRGIRYPMATIIDAGGNSGILQAAQGTLLVLENIGFYKGAAEAGGAVYTKGALQIVNCAFMHNKAENGGAIYSEGPTQLSTLTCQHNRASNCGGVIFYTGTLRLDHGVFSENSDACGRRVHRSAGGAGGGNALGAPEARKMLGGGAGVANPGGAAGGGGGGEPEHYDVSGVISRGSTLDSGARGWSEERDRELPAIAMHGHHPGHHHSRHDPEELERMRARHRQTREQREAERKFRDSLFPVECRPGAPEVELRPGHVVIGKQQALVVVRSITHNLD
jgi:predicted outer membrane repeat protein